LWKKLLGLKFFSSWANQTKETKQWELMRNRIDSCDDESMPLIVKGFYNANLNLKNILEKSILS
jgi:hypothetical protein